MKPGPKRKLSVERQAELRDCLRQRLELTDKRLAQRFQIHPGTLRRYHRRLIVKGEVPIA